MRTFFSSRLVRELSIFNLLLSGALFLFGIVFPNQLGGSEIHTEALLVQPQAKELAKQIQDNWSGSPIDLGNVNRMLSSNAQRLGARLAIFSPQGALMAGSDPNGSPDRAPTSGPEVTEAARGSPAYATRPDPMQGDLWLYLAVPFHSSDGSRWVLRFGVPLPDVEREVQVSRWILWGSAVAVLLVGGSLIFRGGRAQSAATRRLVQTVERMRAGNWENAEWVAERGDLRDVSLTLASLAQELKQKLGRLEPEATLSRTVLERMSDGAVIVDPEGRVRLANPAAGMMFDRKGQEMEGMSLMQALRRHEIHELWEQVRDTGEQQSCEFAIQAERRSLQAVATPLGPRLPGNVLLLFQDLTRLRQLETIRRDFVSNISHELRTPLASLKAMIETLQNGALEDPSAARPFLTHIEREVDALIQIVQELLELSRIESGQVPLRMEKAQPQELVSGAVGRLQHQAERAGLTIHVDSDPDLPDVWADPPRVEQVLVNLLHNAIKFTPPGGSIAVQLRKGGDRVRFEVTDTGVGIAEEDLTRIFERFYKADRSRSGGGTGLGLSIARHLVEAHGGQIGVTSVEGKGSCFFFTLRRAP